MRYTSRIYLDESVELQKLGNTVVGFFKEEGFLTQMFTIDHMKVIQAKKGGILRTLLSTNKALTTVIRGEPNKIEIFLGVREWIDEKDEISLKGSIKNPMKYFDPVPESLWAYEIEHHLWNHIEINIEIGL